MYKRVRYLLPLIVTLAACSESSTEPDSSINADLFAQAAVPLLSSFTVGPTGLPAQVPCPAGGSLQMQGTTSFQANGNEFASTWDFTVQHNDCAIAVNARTLMTSGSTTSTGQMRMRPPAQPGGRVEMLEYEARNHGQLTTRDGNQSRTCSFDLTQHYDAVRKEMRMTGTSCGQTINLVRGQ
jgi:hypothetical protein